MGAEFPGPLHLQRYLTDCGDELTHIIRTSVTHPTSIVHAIHCECTPSVIINLAARQKEKEAARGNSDRRVACRFFNVKTNDEEGIVHLHCRRCHRMILAYDRALYWGVKRKPGSLTETYPHMCSCGSHTFEVAVGFAYPHEALDENDLDTITIAVRCASCSEVAIIFDDEAT